MPRDITLNELARLNVLDAAATDLRVQTEDNLIERYADKYEQAVDRFVAVARPHLWNAPFPPVPPASFSPRPDGAAGAAASSSEAVGDQNAPAGSVTSSPDLASVRDPRSPDAAAEGAIPLPGGGTAFTAGLLTYEGLHDALIARHRDMCEGHFQFAPRDWPGEVARYIIRHAEQQDEIREAGRSLAVAEFIAQRCVLGRGLTVHQPLLKADYEVWCKHKGITPLKGRDFNNEILRLGCWTKISNGSRWVGIALAEAAEREAAE